MPFTGICVAPTLVIQLELMDLSAKIPTITRSEVSIHLRTACREIWQKHPRSTSLVRVMAGSTMERGVVRKRIDASIATCSKDRHALQTELEVFIALPLLPVWREARNFLPSIANRKNIRGFQDAALRPSSLTAIASLRRCTIRPIHSIEESVEEVEAPIISVKDFEYCDVLRVDNRQSYFNIGIGLISWSSVSSVRCVLQGIRPLYPIDVVVDGRRSHRYILCELLVEEIEIDLRVDISSAFKETHCIGRADW